jgi:hypothetical protein
MPSTLEAKTQSLLWSVWTELGSTVPLNQTPPPAAHSSELLSVSMNSGSSPASFK